MQVLHQRTEQDADGANYTAQLWSPLLARIKRDATTTANCERTEVVNKLLDGINATVKTPRKPATWKQVNGQVRGLSLPQLYALLKACQTARVFGAMFWHLARERRTKK